MAQSSNNFQQLVKEWYSKEGKDPTKDAPVLLQKLKDMVDAFMRKINNVDPDDKSIGETGCGEIIFGGKKITDEKEQIWCSFLLQNLMKIELSKAQNASLPSHNKKMQEYIQCQVMRALSYIYSDMYCGVNESLTAIFNKVNEQQCTSWGSPGNCGSCQHGILDTMSVGGQRVLDHIFDKMKTGIPVFIKQYKLSFKEQCNITKPGQKASTQLDPKVQNLINQIRQEILSATASVSSPTAKHQYDALADALIQWFTDKKISVATDFKDKLWTHLEEIFDDIMKNVFQDPTEINSMCSGIVGNRNRNFTTPDKELCKVMVKIRSYINGVKILPYNRFGEVQSITGQEEVDAYLRCLLGRAVLVRWLGGHTSKGKVARTVLDAVKKWDGFSKVKEEYRKCNELDLGRMRIAGNYIWPQLEKWATEKKGPSAKSSYIKQGIQRLESISNQGKPKVQAKSPAKADPPIPPEDQDALKELFVVKNVDQVEELVQEAEVAAAAAALAAATPSDPGGVAGVGTPAAAKPAPPTPENCIQKEKNNLCNRLDCMKHLWENKAAAGKTSTSATNTFWTKDVKELWKELSNAMKGKEHDNGSGCSKIGDSNGGTEPRDATHSEKTACNYLHAGFKQLYEPDTSLSGTTNSGNLSTKHPSFRQTMGCFLLHAYAKIMKEKATCLIDDGIQKAFDLWKKPEDKAPTYCSDANGKEPCVPCQWQADDKNWENCTINTNVTNGQSLGQGEKIERKLKTIVNEGDFKIKQMLTKINEMNKLCDHMKCIASYLNSTNGKQPSKTASTFWTKGGEVGKLWTELSEEMTKNGTNGNTECEQVDGSRPATEPEKKACNYLHVGFKKLKELSQPTTPPKKDDKILDKDPLLKQAMGCFLLHAYAKKMKNDAKCEIEAGIKKAFEVGGKDLSNNVNCNGGKGQCVPCHWNDATIDDCEINTTGTTPKAKVTDKLTPFQNEMKTTLTTIMEEVNKTESLCDKLKCAVPRWFQNQKNKNQAGSSGSSTANKTWCDFWDTTVKDALDEMFNKIEENGKNNATKTDGPCRGFGDGNADSVERKACNHIAAGLNYIKQIPNGATATQPNGKDNQLLQQTVGCIALNMYATKIKEMSQDKCPIDEDTIKKMFKTWNQKNNNISCLTSGGANNKDCFVCEREDFSGCNLLVDEDLIGTSASPNGQKCNDNKDKDNVQIQVDELLKENNTPKVKETLSTITDIKTSSFCTKLQCAAKQYHKSKKKVGKSLTTLSWSEMESDIRAALKQLLNHMTNATNQKAVDQYCNENNDKWGKYGTKQSQTNKAACLLFASGLKHIYGHGNGRPNGHKVGPVNGPSFAQTMGCLFLKEYAKQLEKMAEDKKEYKVHPLCSVDKGIKHAFEQSAKIMNDTPPCKNNVNSCFECKIDKDYDDCKIGQDKIKDNVESLFKDQQNKNLMEKTLENTLCPILPMDFLTPFLPLAPVSIGLSVMAYYLWKYFGPLGKGGPRFRRSPTEIPGPSVQEQVLDHVQQDSSHEYRLVKERKPRSAPTRTKRSGPVNRRTIIEIHFEVLDECQKGDTQWNQKDFLELLVREFMGSELMEEEQVPMEGVPLERVPNLGSGFMV
ncbi:SICAvar, type I [Plasmodium knowlesi strain H]|uniref:SICAvar, type I n=3 Tax=Plasmodium knowlesi TaxID=5850 RepID=A0A5K1TVR1_PLAKH|nr:SICAvar, type I [Plasmodium knowlesi strain H]OTN64635.1 SICAvar type I [Plasmodium knowlesi]CAA9988991.1 SICAvar, type I [Plasmodium knowlesi strain H]SBO24835.1 SICAvar, type I [Plasmodium knowlesi strain H]SBO28098.1 SICAvar, type I [Plasmodium knowlesi strain H]VVS78465.1 SICAvar, type I [Plasmodium knowlesi strain H]|eukprot:XP_002261338.1 SICA antigen [Plasmodium knowlesi strain H]